MTTLMYQSGNFFKCQVREGVVLITNQQEQVTPQVGDRVAIGRHYAKAYEGVVLDASGKITELRRRL